MAYVGEEEVWRCSTHPSKRRRHGVCPLCLRDKLINLCQNCANVRPCDCPDPAEPTELKRSKSLATVSNFLRSKSTHYTKQQPLATGSNLPPTANKSSNSFWSKLLKTKKKERSEDHHDHDKMEKNVTMMMMRSKSVGMGFFSNFGSFREGGGRSTTSATNTTSSSDKTTSSKGWFVSPVKALKQSKAAKVNNDNNSPLCRG